MTQKGPDSPASPQPCFSFSIWFCLLPSQTTTPLLFIQCLGIASLGAQFQLPFAPPLFISLTNCRFRVTFHQVHLLQLFSCIISFYLFIYYFEAQVSIFFLYFVLVVTGTGCHAAFFFFSLFCCLYIRLEEDQWLILLDLFTPGYNFVNFQSCIPYCASICVFFLIRNTHDLVCCHSSCFFSLHKS